MTDKPIDPEAAIKFLRGASIWFQLQGANSREDVSIQAHHHNARTCERIADLLAEKEKTA